MLPGDFKKSYVHPVNLRVKGHHEATARRERKEEEGD